MRSIFVATCLAWVASSTRCALGRPPFRAETAYGVVEKITDSQPRSLQEINPRIPAWLEHIVDKLIAKQPSESFSIGS